jgi:hypothetical protein
MYGTNTHGMARAIIGWWMALMTVGKDLDLRLSCSSLLQAARIGGVAVR